MAIKFVLESFEGNKVPVNAVRIFLTSVQEMNANGAGTFNHSVLSVVENEGRTKTFPINGVNKLILAPHFPQMGVMPDTPRTNLAPAVLGTSQTP